MWIVRLALARPYTFIVMALVIVLLTPVVLMRTPTDIFPEINIPVISLVWTYNGLQPQEMERRITSSVERGITVLVNDVEHIESQSLNGLAIIKIYFQPNAAAGHHLFGLHRARSADRSDERSSERAADF